MNQLEGYSSMQASKKYASSNGSQQVYYQHDSMSVQEEDFNCSRQNLHTVDHTYVDGVTQPSNNTVLQRSQEQYCTLESSATAGYPVQHSPSTQSLSSNSGSPVFQQDCQSDHTYGSPVSGSCITVDQNDLKHKLRELENAMLGPDLDIIDFSDSTFQGQLPHGDLKQVLIACAKAVAENNIFMAELLMGEIKQMVSVSGEPLERLGAYLYEGLVARMSSSGSSIYKALKCKEPASAELLSYMHLLYEVCPYFKFGYMSANGAIAEALKGESRVHIIDFQIAMGTQWMTLIQALAARPGGPPHVRITGIDDPVSAYARGGGLHIVGQRLARLAEACHVPFEFHPAALSGSDVELEHLGIRPGEALAVNFAYQLHHMPDESVSTRNDRDRILRMVKSLSPKVVTLVEQESNTNTAPFLSRFMETMDYYSAVFESIDVKLPRDHKERISVEQHCVARDIVNIIACEGAERVERHELLGKWRSRFTMAGFTPYPLSPLVNATIKTLLENYCEHYRLQERDGAMYLGWKNRALVVSCAWR